MLKTLHSKHYIVGSYSYCHYYYYHLKYNSENLFCKRQVIKHCRLHRPHTKSGLHIGCIFMYGALGFVVVVLRCFKNVEPIFSSSAVQTEVIGCI